MKKVVRKSGYVDTHLVFYSMAFFTTGEGYKEWRCSGLPTGIRGRYEDFTEDIGYCLLLGLNWLTMNFHLCRKEVQRLAAATTIL